MKLLKISAIVIFLSSFSTALLSVEKEDCTKIDNSTLVGNAKYLKCKMAGGTVKSNTKAAGKTIKDKIKGLIKNPLKPKSE
tara:strand:- start:89 stop:331 length:243 start_codon:yes stop_codon:yes gene_type:complete